MLSGQQHRILQNHSPRSYLSLHFIVQSLKDTAKHNKIKKSPHGPNKTHLKHSLQKYITHIQPLKQRCRLSAVQNNRTNSLHHHHLRILQYISRETTQHHWLPITTIESNLPYFRRSVPNNWTKHIVINYDKL